MIIKTQFGYEFKGIDTKLYSFIDTTKISISEILSAVMHEKLESPLWNDETTIAQKIADIIKQEVPIYNIYLKALIDRIDINEDYNILVKEVKIVKDMQAQIMIALAEVLSTIDKLTDNELEEEYISVKEYAALVGITAPTVYTNMVKPSKKFGVYYDKRIDMNIVFHYMDIWRTSKKIVLESINKSYGNISKLKTTKVLGRTSNKRKAKRLAK